RPGQDATGTNRLAGTVAEAIYLGPGAKYEVKPADASTAIVRWPLAGESFGPGDKVELCFDGADAKLLPDDSTADTT
uniref:TOBE domain-containing protein n=1 Tax=Mesorhizobium sp. GbtcB19 TaxID=2824764 RepID=UPI001C2F454A